MVKLTTTSIKESSMFNYDFVSLYPTTMKDFNDDVIKLLDRRRKLDKILNRISNNE